MTRSPASRIRWTAGFTLLEMLVVLTILALVAAVAVPRFAAPPDGLRLEATSRTIVGALRLTRAASVARGTETVFVVDVEQRTFQSPATPLQRFPSDIAAKLKIADPERLSPSAGGFRFFPDGSSTGGDLVLSLRGKERKICVNWLTGVARQRDDC